MFALSSRRAVRTAFGPRVRHILVYWWVKCFCKIVSILSLHRHDNLTTTVTLVHLIPIVNLGMNKQISRTFAEDAVKSASSETKNQPPGMIAQFISRVSSFLVGAGLTALASQYYIFEELREGNKKMIEKQKDIESRLKKLEKWRGNRDSLPNDLPWIEATAGTIMVDN